MNDLISRRAAIDAIGTMFAPTPTQKDMVEDCLEIIDNLPSTHPDMSEYSDKLWRLAFERGKEFAKTEQRWIPIKTRPMTEEERQHWEEHFGMRFDDEDATIFDCPMPEDGQCVWLTTKNGYLFQDVVENDDGMIGLEGNGDWDDIIAWMFVYKPEPYREDGDNNGE